MKKGIVLELDEEFVTVLTPEGEFLRLKKEGDCEVGEEIEARAVKKTFLFHRRSFQYAVVSALAAAVLLVITWIQWPSDAVCAYMSIDINPSIETGVDDELRVLTLKAYNEEGKHVIAALTSWKHEPFSAVAKQIIELSEKKGYLKEGGEVLIATVEKEHNDSSARKLSAELAEIQRSVANERIVITTVNSTMEVRNRAAKQGMTTGKLLQIQKKAKPSSSTSAKPNKEKEEVGKKESATSSKEKGQGGKKESTKSNKEKQQDGKKESAKPNKEKGRVAKNEYAKSSKEKEQGGKKEKETLSLKGQKLEQLPQMKQRHSEQKANQQKKEKQPPHEWKNSGLEKHSSPSDEEISLKGKNSSPSDKEISLKGKNYENARPSRPGDHHANKKAVNSQQDRNDNKDRHKLANVHRQPKSIDSKMKKVE
ncbi:anti-sigma factor domain-containing protein [Geobacillus sp. MR]|uniref:anti-sigma factor domain-containing protein n=1 Tax=Geobacillus sp. MR TaxID=2508875 RepID=UPI00148D8546|nr:anti-sigma factor domain-containing protein [Geobacillus sp. MR]